MHGYATKAVVSAALDARRRRSSRELVTDRFTETAGPDAHDAVDERQQMLAALSRLPAGQRACVALRYYEDLPVAEVAEILGLSTGTVKSQTARGLASLKAHVRDDVVVPERSTS